VIDLDREAGLPDEAAVLRDAIHEFFSQRAQAFGRRLRELFRLGRTSLVIGLVAVASAIALGDFLAALMKGSRIGEIVRESLTIGGWVSMVVGIRLPLYPRLRVRLMGQFPAELVRSVVTGELNLALVTAPTVNGDVTAVPFAQTPLYAALPENHPASDNEGLELQDLAEDEWILFPKRLHPIFYDTIMEVARRDGIMPRCTHAAVTAEQAVQWVSEQVGAGIISKPHPLAFRTKGVVLKPFSEKSLWFQTCVVMRKDVDSRLTNQFVRSFLRKYKLPTQPGSQMELSLSA
jgi:LysR substrate binding domain